MQTFSLRGLRTIQNGLLLSGMVVAPLCLFLTSQETRLTFSILLFFACVGYFSINTAIKKKVQVKMESAQKKQALFNRFEQELEGLERIYHRKGFSHDKESKQTIQQFRSLFANCQTLKDYENLVKKVIAKSQLIMQTDSYIQTNSRLSVSPLYKKALAVLDLPETTKDMKRIKSAYRSLLKKNHPDVNDSVGSDIRTKQIVESYEYLTAYFNK